MKKVSCKNCKWFEYDEKLKKPLGHCHHGGPILHVNSHKHGLVQSRTFFKTVEDFRYCNNMEFKESENWRDSE